MNTFISGGCKNGKSYYAQRLAQQQARERNVPLYYIATMIPGDEEDYARIKRHIEDRAGWGFETIEQPVDLTEILDRSDVDLRGSFLLDSVTAILENEMFPRVRQQDEKRPGEQSPETAEEAADKTVEGGLKGYCNVEITEDAEAAERVKADMTAFARGVARAGGNVVFVSDGIYGDKGEYSASTENYRRALAAVDRALASECERVIEIAYGMETVWK